MWIKYETADVKHIELLQVITETLGKHSGNVAICRFLFGIKI